MQKVVMKRGFFEAILKGLPFNEDLYIMNNIQEFNRLGRPIKTPNTMFRLENLVLNAKNKEIEGGTENYIMKFSDPSGEIVTETLPRHWSYHYGVTVWGSNYSQKVWNEFVEAKAGDVFRLAVCQRGTSNLYIASFERTKIHTPVSPGRLNGEIEM